MALGVFIMLVSACGSGVTAFLFFLVAHIAWKGEKRTAAGFLVLFGAVCTVFAVYLASFLPEALHFLFHFKG